MSGQVVRQFDMVASNRSVHVVKEGQFWQGDKSWEHRALCGRSVSGVAVKLQRVTCRDCRRAMVREGTQ